MIAGNHSTNRARQGPWLRWTLSWGIVLGSITMGAWYMTFMPGKSWSAPVPSLSREEREIHDYLKQHVEMLATQIGERNVWHAEALNDAALYIRNTLEGLGYRTRTQSFQSEDTTVQNIEIELPGNVRPEEVIVLGAHYDSAFGTPGANDNASGVAALLEIARLLVGTNHSRTLRLVAFANEEAPFFYTDAMGSWVYAANAHRRGDQIKAMIALETLGYYTDQPGSQRYPFPFSLFYPDTGNFIGFVGNLNSRQLVRQALGAFRGSTAFPSEGVAAPAWVTGVGWSDHWSFWQVGYPAIMVTDTALFRYRHYHAPSDTAEKLDYKGLARVTSGLVAVAIELAGN